MDAFGQFYAYMLNKCIIKNPFDWYGLYNIYFYMHTSILGKYCLIRKIMEMV